MATYKMTPADRQARAQLLRERRGQQLGQFRARELARANQRAYRANEAARTREEREIQNASVGERLGATAADVGVQLGGGIVKGLEGVVDALATAGGAIAGIFDEDARDAVQGFVEYDFTGEHIMDPLYEAGTKKSYFYEGKAGEITQNVLHGLGGMLPAVGVSFIPGVGPGIALATMATSAGGNAAEEAYKDGAGYYQGVLYGTVSGAVEAVTEKLTGGLTKSVFGKGLLDDVLKIGDDVAATGIKRVAKGMAEEAAEEALAEAANPALKSIYKGKDAFADYLDPAFYGRVGESAVVGGLTSLAYGGTVGKIANRITHTNVDIKDSLDAIDNMSRKQANLWVNKGNVDTAEFRAAAEGNLKNIEKALQKESPTERASLIEQYRLQQIADENGMIREGVVEDLIHETRAAAESAGATAEKLHDRRYVSPEAWNRGAEIQEELATINADMRAQNGFEPISEAEGIDNAAEVQYNKKQRQAYSQYNTSVMQWAFATTTKPGDTKLLYDPQNNTWNYLVADNTEERYGVLNSIEDTPENAQKIQSWIAEVYNESDGTGSRTDNGIRSDLENFRNVQRVGNANSSNAERRGAVRFRSDIDRTESTNNRESVDRSSAGAQSSEVNYSRKPYRYNFSFLHKNFPSETETHSEAHRLAVWWTNSEGVSVGDRTLISMHDVWYVVEKFDDTPTGYQVEERITKKEYQSIFERVKKYGRSGRIKPVQGSTVFIDRLDQRRGVLEGGKSSVDSDLPGHGGENQQIQSVDQESAGGRERSSRDGAGDRESSGSNRQGENVTPSLKPTDADAEYTDVGVFYSKKGTVKRPYRYNFSFLHKNFPSETETHSEAHRLAVWWAHNKNVQSGDQTLISMRGVWYVVEKFSGADNGYQVEERLTVKEFKSVFEEIKQYGRSGQIKSVQKGIDGNNQRNQRSGSAEGEKSSFDRASSGHGRENSEVVRLDQREAGGRERSSRDGAGDRESSGSNRYGENVTPSLKPTDTDADAEYTDVGVFEGELPEAAQENYKQLKKAVVKLSSKTPTGMGFVLLKENPYFNGVVLKRGNIVYITADTLASGTWAAKFVHEVFHFAEGTVESRAVLKFLTEDAALTNKVVQRLTNKKSGYGFQRDTYKSLKKKIQRNNMNLTPEEERLAGELGAHMSEEVLGNERFIERVVREDASLAEKIMGKLHDLMDAFKSLTSREARTEYKRLQQAEKLYLDAVEHAGLHYVEGQISKALAAAREEAEKEEREELPKNKYSYEALTSKDDISVVEFPSDIPLKDDGRIDNKEVVARGKLNAQKQNNPNNTETSTYVRIDDIGQDVLLGTKGLDRGLARSKETARAVMKIGDILKSSVAVNELNGSTERQTEMSYVLLGACRDSKHFYVVRSVVSKLQNEVTEFDIYQISAVKAKKAETPNPALVGAAVTEQSSLISSESPTISIAELFEKVKNLSLANEVFSKDVLKQLGVGRSEGTLSKDVRYSLPDGKKNVDPRSVTEEDVRTLLERVKKRQYKDSTYIPIRINTPQVLIDAAKEFGEPIENLPMLISVGKARQAMADPAQWIREGNITRPHELSVDDMIEIVRSMNHPKYIIYQTAVERYVEVVEFETKNKETAIAVIEVGEHKNPEYLNGYSGGKYQVLVTTFTPDDGIVGDMLENPQNKVLFPQKKKGSSQRGSSNNVLSHLNDSPFAISISDSNQKNNRNNKNNSEKVSYSLKTDRASTARKIKANATANNKRAYTKEDVAKLAANFFVDNYTEEQYNNFGWVRANDILSEGQARDFYSKFADAITGRARFPKTKSGEYMIAVSDIYDSDFEGVNNTIVYVKGKIESPQITRVLDIDEYDGTILAKRRRDIYAIERRGIQQKTGGVCYAYVATDFRYSWNRSRNDTENGRNHDELGVRRGGSGETAGTIKAIHFDDEGNEVSREVQFSLKTDRAATTRKIKANATANNKRIYTKADSQKIINSAVSDILNFGDQNGSIYGKANDEAVDLLWHGLNTAEPGKQGGVALNVARFIIQNAVVSQVVDEQKNAHYKRVIDILQHYRRRLDLSGIKAELLKHYGKDNSVFLRWGVRKGVDAIAPDQLKDETLLSYLKAEGIEFDSDDPASVVIQMDELYSKAVKEIKAQSKQRLSEAYSKEQLHELEQKIARQVLRDWETSGKASALSKQMVEFADQMAKMRETVRKTKQQAADSRARDRAMAALASQVISLKKAVKNRNYRAHQLNDPLFRDSIERMFNYVTRNNNLSADVVRRNFGELSKWYTEDNPLLKNGFAQSESGVENTLFVPFVKGWLDDIAAGTGELSVQECKNAKEVFSYFKHFVEEYHRVNLNGELVDAPEAARGFIDVINEAGDRANGITSTFFKSTFGREVSDPNSVMKFGDQYNEKGFFQTMRNAFTKGGIDAAWEELDIRRGYEAFLKEHKHYQKRLAEATVEYRGQQMPLHKAMYLYMVGKREQLHAGLVRGGIHVNVDRKQAYKLGWTDNKHSDQTGYRFEGIAPKEQSPETIRRLVKEQNDALEAQFSEEDLAYIKVLEDMMVRTTVLKRITDYKRFGTTNVTEGYYIMGIRAEVAQSIDNMSFLEYMDRVTNFAFNKSTVQGASSTLLIDDATTVVLRHVKQMALYAHLSIPTDTFNKLYNLNINEGNPNSPQTIKSNLQKTNTGKEICEYLFKLKRDIEGNVRTEAADRWWNRMIGKVRKNIVVFQLALNIKVRFSQASSLLAATNFIDVDCIVKAVGVPNKGAEIDEYCHLAEVRNHENTAALAISVTDQLSKVGDTLLKDIGAIDRGMNILLFGACQLQIAKDGGPAVGTKENKVKAGELLTRVILETQQNSLASERSGWMRSEGEIRRGLTMFTADNLKVISRVIDAVGEISAIKRQLRKENLSSERRQALKAALKAAKKRLRRALAAMLSTALYMTIIALGLNALLAKNDDKEEEEIVKDTVGDFFGNLIGGLPVIREVYSGLVEGYEADTFLFSTFNDVVQGGRSVMELCGDFASGKDVSKQDILGTLKKTSYAVGQLTGLPTRNAYNLFTGLSKRFLPSFGYTVESQFTPQNYSADLNAAIEAGDDRMVATIAGLMINEDIGSLSKDAREALRPLVEAGYKVLPRTVGDTVTHDGEEIKLTRAQKKRFQTVYSAADEAVEDLVKLSVFRNATQEEQARALRFIWDTYFSLAMDDLLGEDSEKKAVLFAEAIPIEKLAMVVATAQSITADTDNNGRVLSGSRKAKITSYISSLRMTAVEKYMLMGWLGYVNVHGEAQVKAYINTLNLSKNEKKDLLQFSGYSA